MKLPAAAVDRWETISKNIKAHSEAVAPYAAVSLQTAFVSCFTALHMVSCTRSEEKHSPALLLPMLSLIPLQISDLSSVIFLTFIKKEVVIVFFFGK